LSRATALQNRAKNSHPNLLAGFSPLIGSLLFLLGIAIAICILIAGRSLAKHTRYWFAFVVACIECLFIPFGTILGVFTIIVLSRDSVKELFPAAVGKQYPTG
jgi:hypothetical protein